jgi:hypothetical protein
MYVEGRMGENQNNGKEYDPTLSFIFNVVECLRRILKLKIFYQSKSLVNKLFLRKQLYLLNMSDGSSLNDHMNSFNTIISHLSFIDIKINEEEKCITILCFLPDS